VAPRTTTDFHEALNAQNSIDAMELSMRPILLHVADGNVEAVSMSVPETEPQETMFGGEMFRNGTTPENGHSSSF